jgi:hypothetical protein
MWFILKLLHCGALHVATKLILCLFGTVASTSKVI